MIKKTGAVLVVIGISGAAAWADESGAIEGTELFVDGNAVTLHLDHCDEDMPVEFEECIAASLTCAGEDVREAVFEILVIEREGFSLSIADYIAQSFESDSYSPGAAFNVLFAGEDGAAAIVSFVDAHIDSEKFLRLRGEGPEPLLELAETDDILSMILGRQVYDLAPNDDTVDFTEFIQGCRRSFDFF